MIKIICVGKLKDNYMRELTEDYLKRISKYHKIEIIELKDNDNIHKECEEILKVLNPKDYNIGLCIDGYMYDSLSFSSHLDDLFNISGTITFIIGGSNGLDRDVTNKCNELISFSKLTFPHGLFRGILLEQIYRAFKIMNNETYHK